MSLFQPQYGPQQYGQRNDPYMMPPTTSNMQIQPQQMSQQQAQQQQLSWHPLIDQYMRMFLNGSQQ